MKRLLIAVVAIMAGAGLMAGCGSSSSGSAGTGTLKVAITDKMSEDCKSVVVTIKEIRAVPAGRENAPDDSSSLPVIVRFDPPYKTVDVMSLQFQAELLGQAVIPAGSYTQLRLILADNQDPNNPANYLTLNADDPNYPKYEMKTPSGQQSGLKLLGRFTVERNQVTALMIDFDPNTAIVETGNGKYILKPTGIRLVALEDVWTNYGSLIGSVFAPAPWNGQAFLEVRQGVRTVASGAVFANYTAGSYQPAAFSAFVPTGSYKAFLSATGFTIYSSPMTSVVAGSPSDLGAVTLKP